VIDRLFAYGTLLPGQIRWRFLEPLVVDHGVACAVAGDLYDTGLGYPAAVFGGDGRVHGRVFRFRDGLVERALGEIDEVERIADELYRRVRLDVGGGAAWAYEYTGEPRFVPIGGGSWGDHAGTARTRSGGAPPGTA
jgi:gamma-glutamylcyclotransferase (GGCT)/AIG2-like uncharacterized protein YtfP